MLCSSRTGLIMPQGNRGSTYPAVQISGASSHRQPAGDGYQQTRVVTDLAAVEMPGLGDLTVDLSGIF